MRLQRSTCSGQITAVQGRARLRLHLRARAPELTGDPPGSSSYADTSASLFWSHDSHLCCDADTCDARFS